MLHVCRRYCGWLVKEGGLPLAALALQCAIPLQDEQVTMLLENLTRDFLSLDIVPCVQLFHAVQA